MSQQSERVSLLAHLRLWIENPHLRHRDWQLSSYYWRMRAVRNRAASRLRALLFKGAATQRDRWGRVPIVLDILRLTITQVVLALAAVVVVDALGPAVLSWGQRMVSPALSRLPWKLPPVQMRPDAYVPLLATLTAVSAGILAVYFTAVSVLFSGVYSRVQSDVRNLLMQDRVGSQYIRLLAFVAAYGALLLAKTAISGAPTTLNLIGITVLGVVALFAAVPLGLRTFGLFDPTPLMGDLVRDLLRDIRSVGPGDRRWLDPVFQSHYQRNAERRIATLRNLAHLGVKQEFVNSRSALPLGRQALILLSRYTAEKVCVPTDSHWFKPTFRHREWLMASYEDVSTALRTSTSIQPETVSDLMWLETQLHEVVVLTLQRLLESDQSAAYELMSDVSDTVRVAGAHYGVEEALRLLRNLAPAIRQGVVQPNLSSDADIERIGFTLAVLDAYGVTLIDLWLKFVEQVRVTTEQSLAAVVADIVWHRRETVYTVPLPRPAVRQLEFLWVRLDFERAVNGDYVSPDWYQQQLVAKGFLHWLKDVTSDLISALENQFAIEAEWFLAQGQHLAAATVIARGLEATRKFTHHLPSLRTVAEGMGNLRLVPDIPWPEIPWDAFQLRVIRIRDRLMTILAEVTPALTNLPRDERLPDFLGQAYSVLREQCYMYLADDNRAGFVAVFPRFFEANRALEQRMHNRLSEFDPRSAVILMTEPLLDALDVSGHAVIQTELTGTDFTSVIWPLWDERASSSKFVVGVHAILGARGGIAAIIPGDVQRTRWHQELERRLRAEGILRERYGWNGRDPRQWSPRGMALRVLGRGRNTTYDPHDLFAAVLTLRYGAADELRLTWQLRMILQALMPYVEGPPSELAGVDATGATGEVAPEVAQALVDESPAKRETSVEADIIPEHKEFEDSGIPVVPPDVPVLQPARQQGVSDASAQELEGAAVAESGTAGEQVDPPPTDAGKQKCP